MNKQAFLSQLRNELEKRGVTDVGDILMEYGQHFDFRCADGYTEEEVSKRLGDPHQIALQYDAGRPAKKSAVFLTGTGLGCLDVLAALLLVFLAAWDLVMGTFGLVCAAAGICLLGGVNIQALLPPMPYWCGAVFAVALLALAVLSALGAYTFFTYLRQCVRAYRRFHRNAMTRARGGAALPSVSAYPVYSPEKRRRLRALALGSLALFGAAFLLGYIVSALSAGAFQFWHMWGWFGYGA